MKNCGMHAFDDLIYAECPRCYQMDFPFTVGSGGHLITSSNSFIQETPTVVKTTDVGAVKHDQNKPDLTLISYELLELIAKVRMFGAKKYSRGNWKKGFKTTRSLAAALRHIFSYLSGEDVDPESGLSHLGHAVCCLEHEIYSKIHHPQNDDRKNVDNE